MGPDAGADVLTESWLKRDAEEPRPQGARLWEDGGGAGRTPAVPRPQDLSLIRRTCEGQGEVVFLSQ